VALEIGNFLNCGNTRFGGAMGYKLDSLLKLADSKAPQAPAGQKLTLAHYVVMHCRKTKPLALVQLEVDLAAVKTAFSYPLDQLTGDIAKVQADVKFLERAAKAAPTGDEHDQMATVVGAYAERMSAGDVKELGEMSAGLDTSMKALCKLFAEPATKAAKGDEVISKLAKFMGMLQAAEQELLAVEKKRLAAVEKEHMASERRQRNTTMAGPALPARPGAMP